MVSAVTFLSIGKNTNTQTTRRKATAPTLIGRPARPRDQRRSGSGVLLTRRMMRHTKEMIYVPKIADTAREPMALKATVEPMLIKERRVVIRKVRRTAFRGMFQPGWTCHINLVS